MTDNYKNIINSFIKNKNLYPKKIDKKNNFLECVRSLNNHHLKLCKSFKNIIEANGFKIELKNKIEDEFFLPVNIFKRFNLLSIKEKNINNQLQSSGTSGNVSKIFLDNNSALVNNRILFKILKNEFKNFNIPIVFLDKEPSQNNIFDARKAAVKGFSILSKNKHYVVNQDDSLNLNKFNKIVKETKDKPAYIFGFTSVLWSLFNKYSSLIESNLSNFTIIHGGGWKKMSDNNINIEKFNNFFFKKFKIKNIKNYYGMVEQIGSIFFNCEFNFFHTHAFSDIVIRDKNLQHQPFKQIGFVQLISLLPRSYPGHSILTEDLGTIFGEDDCKCGRAGKYFKIWGRLPKSEIRGCSDV
jgi:hypothetical protein